MTSQNIDLAALDSAVHSVWLHGDWRWLIKNMDTEEREAFADAVDRHDNTYPPADRSSPIDRWWRPASEEAEDAAEAAILAEWPDLDPLHASQLASVAVRAAAAAAATSTGNNPEPSSGAAGSEPTHTEQPGQRPQAVIERYGRWRWHVFIQDGIGRHDGGDRWGRKRAEKAARKLLADYLRSYYGDRVWHIVEVADEVKIGDSSRRALERPVPGERQCCDMHNINCEPPSNLCCNGCTEATHDAHPIPHPDGSRCVLPVREEFLDFATGWRLAREGVAHTDPRCSYVQHDGGFLCDCGAIETEWARRVREQVADRTGQTRPKEQ